MSFGKFRFIHSALVLVLVIWLIGIADAQQVAPRQRILQSVDNTRLTKLRGNTHPLARAEFDRGRAPDSLPADRMLLLLSRTPEQESALAQLLDEQQTVDSPNYRRWLTPEEFGAKFGAADTDIQTITAWLQMQGFQVNRVSGSKNLIEFSGTAAQVRNSFHTELHKYAVKGKEYWANTSDPQIPSALAEVVKNIVSLNNFPHKPQSHTLGVFSRTPEGTVKPEFTFTSGTSTYYALGPGDFATIYKTSSLLSANIDGSGQSIAIIGETNIDLINVADFRRFFNLSGPSASVIVDGTDPGVLHDEEVEALLDVQWAGAVAPKADVKLVIAQTTTTTAGIYLAANYAIQQNLAGVLSLSYGACEAYLGTAGNQYVQALWQQAAAQGITVLVSTGDEGSAGCDYHGSNDIALHGLAVNGLASTPYNVAVGGTDFDDASALATYWNSTNDFNTLSSVKSYIPEQAWNGSCAATAAPGNLNVCPAWDRTGTPPTGISLDTGSGGASNCSKSSYSNGVITCESGTPKPSWQTGTGVPNDGVRDLPDVSLFSAWGETNSKSFYVVCDQYVSGYYSCQRGVNNFLGVGGTSAAAPSFAGMVALFEQKAGTRLGNINYLLYSIAAKSGSSCTSSASEPTSCIFNDIVKGNNSVPCVAGSPNCSATSGTATGVLVDSNQKPAFTTNTGYDLATGLGSVNAANLATAITTATGGFTPTSTAITLNSNTSTVIAKHGDPINVAVSITPTAATGSVYVQKSTGPAIDNATLTSGSSAWTSTLFPGGNYSVKAHYAGDGTRGASDSNSVQVNISPEDSKTFLEVMNWDDSGNFLGYYTSNLAYGSNYVLRLAVGDAAATLSNTSGMSSKCWNGTASCPSGTLTVTSNGAALDKGTYNLNSHGYAEDQTIQLLPGTYALAASYPGDSSYNPSSATANLTVTKAPVNITFQPTAYSQLTYGSLAWFNVTVAATANGVAPTGTVRLLDNGDSTNSCASAVMQTFARIGTQPAHSTTSACLSFSSSGTHPISLQYSGDSLYNTTESSTVDIQVAKATPDISGSIDLNNTTPVLPVQIHLILSGVYSYTITTAAPTGTVTLLDNGTPIDAILTTQSSGRWTDLRGSYTFAQTGTHVVTLNYSGDNNYAGVSGAPLSTVYVYTSVPTTIDTPWASGSPVLPNQSVTFTTRVNSNIGPTPTGAVTFYDNGSPFTEQAIYNQYSSYSYVTITHTFTTSGTHNITATYQGDNNTATSTSAPLAFSVVDKLPSTTYFYPQGNVVANHQSTIALYAYPQISGNANWPQMTGTFTVSENGTPLNGTITTSNNNPGLSGTFPYTFTTTGTHNLILQYSGDANYVSSQSQATAVNVVGVLGMVLPNGQTFSTPSTGGTGTVNVYVANYLTTPETVTLTCTPDLTQATCSTAPSTTTMNGNDAFLGTASFTVPALLAADKYPVMPWHGKGGLLLGAAFACCALATRKRKALLIMLGTLALTFCMLSCGGGGSSGGGGNPPSPTSKTYHFTVTATDGTNTASQVFTVTVGS